MGRRYKQKRCRREYGSLGSRFLGRPGGCGDSRQGAKTPRHRRTPAFPPPAALILKNRLIFLKNDRICLNNSPLFSKERSPRPCTRMGIAMHPHGSARVPRWVWPCTHMGLPSYPDGFARVPAWVSPRTQMGMAMHPHGSAHAPTWVCPFTRMGTCPNLPESRAHQAWYPGKSARIAGTPRWVPARIGQIRGQIQPLRLCHHPRPAASRFKKVACSFIEAESLPLWPRCRPQLQRVRRVTLTADCRFQRPGRRPWCGPASIHPPPSTAPPSPALWAFLAFSGGPESLPPTRSQGWPDGSGRSGTRSKSVVVRLQMGPRWSVAVGTPCVKPHRRRRLE